jgi:hypothetical protein
MSACNDTASGLITKPEKFSYIEAKRGDLQVLCADNLLINGLAVGAANKRNHLLIDYPSRHGGAGVTSITFGIERAWVEQNGTWTQVLSAPLSSGALTTPLTRATSNATGHEATQEFFDFLNNSFASNAELAPYFFRAEFRTGQITQTLVIDDIYQFGLITSASITNYVLELSRADNNGAGNNSSLLLKYDNTAGPVSAAPGTIAFNDQVLVNPNAGDPSAAGFYTGYSAVSPGYIDETASEQVIGGPFQ